MIWGRVDEDIVDALEAATTREELRETMNSPLNETPTVWMVVHSSSGAHTEGARERGSGFNLERLSVANERYLGYRGVEEVYHTNIIPYFINYEGVEAWDINWDISDEEYDYSGWTWNH